MRAIDGEPIATWQDLRWRVLQAALQRESLQVETLNERGHIGATRRSTCATSRPTTWRSDVLERVGLALYRPPLEPVIGKVEAGAGRSARDCCRATVITHIDGAPIKSWGEMVTTIQQSPEKPLRFGIARDGRALSVQVTPESVRSGGKTHRPHRRRRAAAHREALHAA